MNISAHVIAHSASARLTQADPDELAQDLAQLASTQSRTVLFKPGCSGRMSLLQKAQAAGVESHKQASIQSAGPGVLLAGQSVIAATAASSVQNRQDQIIVTSALGEGGRGVSPSTQYIFKVGQHAQLMMGSWSQARAWRRTTPCSMKFP